MIQFMCFFFPAVISLKFDNNLWENSSTSRIKLWVAYAEYAMLINGVIFGVFCIIPECSTINFSTFDFTLSFALKYLIAACTLAWLLPRVIYFLKQHISVGIDVERK